MIVHMHLGSLDVMDRDVREGVSNLGEVDWVRQCAYQYYFSWRGLIGHLDMERFAIVRRVGLSPPFGLTIPI